MLRDDVGGYLSWCYCDECTEVLFPADWKSVFERGRPR
jgi:hypothetical protein